MTHERAERGSGTDGTVLLQSTAASRKGASGSLGGMAFPCGTTAGSAGGKMAGRLCGLGAVIQYVLVMILDGGRWRSVAGGSGRGWVGRLGRVCMCVCWMTQGGECALDVGVG